MQLLLKVTPADLKNGFLREAAVARVVEHPCLVKVLTHALVEDVAVTGGPGVRDTADTAWIVMEFCNMGRLIVRFSGLTHSKNILVCNGVRNEQIFWILLFEPSVLC